MNTRGTFLCTQACLPHLRKAENPHVLVLSPPLTLEPKWFAPNVAYAIAKYGMSLCVLGMAEEFRPWGIAVNALWPQTIIATAALQVIPNAPVDQARKPEIVSDAAWEVLTGDSRGPTGEFLIDDTVLREAGVTDFEGYAVKPGTALRDDIFV